jgi:hypothetical protein
MKGSVTNKQNILAKHTLPCGIVFIDLDVVRLHRSRDEADAGILVVLRHGVTDGTSCLGI